MALDEPTRADMESATDPPAVDETAGPAAPAPPPRPALRLDVEYAPRVNFAMQQHGVPLIERIDVFNDGSADAADLLLTVRLENEECRPWTQRLEGLAPGQSWRVEPRDLRLSARRMAGRTEAEATTLHVEITGPDAGASAALPIELLPFDHWPGTSLYPELLAAFVTPNHPAIADLLQAARLALQRAGHPDALDGYQSGRRERAALIAEACYSAVAARGLGYINPPAGFEQFGQRVRLADRIACERLGSCLDLSLLLAAMWEQAGLHPLILLPTGHALPAVWTHEAHQPPPVIDEPGRVRNLIELGEIVAVESTLVTQRGATFAAAVEAAGRALASPGADFCAVDVHAARRHRVRPLPLRADGDESELDLESLPPDGPAAADTRLDRVALADQLSPAHTADEPAPDQPGDETGEARLRRWQTRLLDLSLRNRLINFRPTRTTLRLLAPDASALEDRLAEGARLAIHPRIDADDEFLESEFDLNRIHADAAPAETQERLLQIYRTARLAVEETGANLLHLALGMLKWYESDAATVPRYAPLILLPARLYRFATGMGWRYEFGLSDEPLRPNVTLLEKLRVEFGLDTTGLDDLPEDENGLNVPLILRRFRAAVVNTRWEVEESAHLGLFSFNKFLMWRDLRENMDRLRRNRLVSHLVDRPGDSFESAPFPRPEELDDAPPGDLCCTRDADSSQLAAVRAAADGRTFVLEGPPGTGKSQTIANIIADSLARGKRVLFVAEKIAALSVVARRLEQDGLRPFCLELHSAKASKKEVLAQLEESLAATGFAEPDDWEAIGLELGQTRDRLNAYVRELHRERASGESLYRVLGRLSVLGDGPATAPPPDVDPAAVTREQLASWRRAIDELVEVGGAVDPPSEHPLRGIGRSEWSFSLPDQARAALHPAVEALATRRRSGEALLEAVKADGAALDNLSHNGLMALIEAARLLQVRPPVPRPLLTGGDADALDAELRRLVEIGRGRDRRRDDLLSRWREEFLDLDPLPHLDAVTRAARRPGPLKAISGFLARRRLRPWSRGRVPDLRGLTEDLESLRLLRQDSRTLAEARDAIDLFGRTWRDGLADWDAIEAILDHAARFRDIAAGIAPEPAGPALVNALAAAMADETAGAAAAPAAARFIDATAAWTRAWQSVADVLSPEPTALGAEAEPGWAPRAADMLARWSDHLDLLNDWCAWRRARDAALRLGLNDAIDRFERGDIERAHWRHAFERGFGERWFNAIADSIDVVREFNAANHERIVDRFRRLDRRLIERTRDAVTARLSTNVPAGTMPASAPSEMGLLRRELEKKRRHLPTRRLIEATPNLLARLKPCFLMSPLSVAQFLDPALPPFDLVVFDEASQIPVWDAVGAIARGAEVIVVGDSRQLPPTSFFNTLDGDAEIDDETVEIEDMESILKECNAAGVPAMRLDWHYRSRHESLIAFSNRHYYDNRLHTFPSPCERSAELGVTFHHVADGVYDRGGTRTNRVEAERVVEQVVALLTESDQPDSVGVVTFNQAQQALIEDLLDAKRRERPELDRFFGPEVEEPVFVKNLENVQGDERDAVIFSVGYGPDRNGRPSMNFGPLNQDGGERRLNVAVTRARRRLIVFSSLLPDQIDLRRTRSLGVRHFKAFLEYAQRGPNAVAETSDASVAPASTEPSFEQAVREALVQRGWTVDERVGCGGYRVDLAVRDPDRPGRYLLGIECDGRTYRSAHTARDRDRLRRSVLEGLGWKLARVWSTQWRINPQGCIEALERAIDQARRDSPGTTGANSTNAAEPPDESEEAVDGDRPRANLASPPAVPNPPRGLPSTLPTYRRARPGRTRLAGRDPFSDSTLDVAARALASVVEQEGPIVEELALRRLGDWFGLTRITDRFRERFALWKDRAVQADHVRIEGDALWPASRREDEYATFRVPGPDPDDRRDLEQVPLIERINAVAFVLAEQIALPREDLQREAARLLGVLRLTPRAREAIDQAIAEAIHRGRARDAGDRISAPPP